MQSFPIPNVLESMHFVANANIEHKRIVKNYEIDLYLDGNHTITLDGTPYSNTDKCLIFRKPGQFATGIGNYNMYMITLDFSHRVSDEKKLYRNHFGPLQPLCDFNELNDIPPVFRPQNFEEVKELMKKLTQFSYPNIPDTENQKRLIKELLLLILYEATKYKRTKENSFNNVNPHVRRACNFISQNFDQHITLDIIANHLYLNKNYLIKLFNKELGLSPQKFILETRLIRARQLILQTNQSIQEIAFSCGFNTPSYFSKKFKNRFDVLPLTIRQNNGIY